jgi:hypothetical protein
MTYSVITIRRLSGGNRTETGVSTCVDAGLADVPNRRALNHVPHCEAFDGLVFSNGTRTVGTAHEADMATTLLVTTSISSFLGLAARARISMMKRNQSSRPQRRHPPKSTSYSGIFPPPKDVWLSVKCNRTLTMLKCDGLEDVFPLFAVG